MGIMKSVKHPKCPECGSYMVEKGTKLLCSDPQCGCMLSIKKEEEKGGAQQEIV